MNGLKKYELTAETKSYAGRTLYRIRALRDFGNVRKGDLGGFVGSESNLSQKGTCWVYGSAKICDLAVVRDSARVYNSAVVCGEAEVTKATDVFTVAPLGSRNDTTTFYKAKDGKIFVKCGCTNTDIDTWLKMVQAVHGDNKHAKAYKLAANIAKLQILGEVE